MTKDLVTKSKDIFSQRRRDTIFCFHNSTINRAFSTCSRPTWRSKQCNHKAISAKTPLRITGVLLVQPRRSQWTAWHILHVSWRQHPCGGQVSARCQFILFEVCNDISAMMVPQYLISLPQVETMTWLWLAVATWHHWHGRSQTFSLSLVRTPIWRPVCLLLVNLCWDYLVLTIPFLL